MKDSNLGFMLNSFLKQHSFSMRKLSTLAGIDTATISRIVNGKQNPKHDHLQKFAQYLDIPIGKLYEAAGYLQELSQRRPGEIELGMKMDEGIVLGSAIL